MVNKRKVGGRPKRKQKIAGCPKVIMEHIRQYQGQNTNVQSPSQQTNFYHLRCVPRMILCVEVVVTSLILKFMSQLMIHCDHDSCHGIIYLCDVQRHM